ncbi:unnamed protein product [Mesocestoides corti]|uniref:CVNH domain-containing protein n=1 Tax=Mesocestoides corti TaxID=53468 RepID=A0A0R3UJ72_MESCO|nr:unnamed protein product [Mesocestoides corti]
MTSGTRLARLQDGEVRRSTSPHLRKAILRGCVPVAHPITGKVSNFCSNDELWNTTTVDSNWRQAKVDLTSAHKSDFKSLSANVKIWNTSSLHNRGSGWRQSKVDLNGTGVGDFKGNLPPFGRPLCLSLSNYPHLSANVDLWNTTAIQASGSDWKMSKVDLQTNNTGDFKVRETVVSEFTAH